MESVVFLLFSSLIISKALAGADWLPKFWWDFFSRGHEKKKIAAKTKLLT
jgi:hypothetical protein